MPASTRIQDLIREASRQLRAEFEEIKKSNPHFAERGAEAEAILRDFLNDHLPKRFAADSGLVVDEDGGVSAQCDVIVYDAVDSPIYRKGKRVLILPSDNVAVVIEVKSTLNKAELEDAAKKVASVKALKRSPLSSVDQPVTLSRFVMTRPLGIVFAYDATTSLDTLAENLAAINESYPSDHWIDLVVVLDKGVVGYSVQMIFTPDLGGWHGGPAVENFMVPPFYVHLTREELGDLTLNRFFVSLTGHLTFYRRRSAVRFSSLLGEEPWQAMAVRGYQYNLKRQLIEAEAYHQENPFRGAKTRFNIRNTKEDRLVGQIGWIPWQDGAVISYSGELPSPIVFQPYFDAAKANAGVMPVPGSPRVVSSVLPLTEEQFVEIAMTVSGDFSAERCADADPDYGWFRKEK